MGSFKKVILGLVIFFSVVYILTLFVDGKYYEERSVLIDKPALEVFDYVKQVENQYGFRKFISDTTLTVERRGQDGIKGYIISWKNNESEIQGEESIEEIIPNERVDFKIKFISPIETESLSYIKVKSLSENQTELFWGMKGEVPYPASVFMLFKDYGDAMDKGLVEFKSILEK